MYLQTAVIMYRYNILALDNGVIITQYSRKHEYIKSLMICKNIPRKSNYEKSRHKKNEFPQFITQCNKETKNENLSILTLIKHAICNRKQNTKQFKTRLSQIKHPRIFFALPTLYFSLRVC